MSCKHGNWEPRGLRGEDRREQLAYERGFAAGVTAAINTQTQPTIDGGALADGYVLRGVTMWHFARQTGTPLPTDTLLGTCETGKLCAWPYRGRLNAVTVGA